MVPELGKQQERSKENNVRGALARLLLLILGIVVTEVGIAMLVLPGPAIVVIPLGVSILATEFAWARRIKAYGEKKLGLSKELGRE